MIGLDGGDMSTDLSMAWNEERGWSIEEMQWRDIHNSRVCLFEVWYRHWAAGVGDQVAGWPGCRVRRHETAAR